MQHPDLNLIELLFCYKIITRIMYLFGVEIEMPMKQEIVSYISSCYHSLLFLFIPEGSIEDG